MSQPPTVRQLAFAWVLGELVGRLAPPPPAAPPPPPPTPSKTSKASPPSMSKPTPSKTSKASPPSMSKPTPSKTSKASPPSMSKPTPSKTSKASPPSMSKPTPSRTSPKASTAARRLRALHPQLRAVIEGLHLGDVTRWRTADKQPEGARVVALDFADGDALAVELSPRGVSMTARAGGEYFNTPSPQDPTRARWCLLDLLDARRCFGDARRCLDGPPTP